MGAPVDPWTMAQTVDAIDALVKGRCFAHAIGVNADKLLQMRDDPEMDAWVRRCEVVNADGASMVIAAHKLGTDLPERVAGIDLMWELCSLAEREGYRVYLLGAKAEVVKKAIDVLVDKYPGMTICGYRDGYFGNDEFDSVVAGVGGPSPTSFLWVSHHPRRSASLSVSVSWEPKVSLWVSVARLTWSLAISPARPCGCGALTLSGCSA